VHFCIFEENFATMDDLFEKQNILLKSIKTNFRRYLYDKIAWNSRMIGIIGARGVGKTTMLLQYIKSNLNPDDALYVSADDLYFGQHTLYSLADEFYKNDGKHLFIDEVHKYKNWSQELKNIYDSFPSLKITFTGSSILDIIKGSSDLSRRALIYKLNGLSFREYLKLYHDKQVSVYSLNEILNQKIELQDISHPLPLFKDYLKRGYFPFGLESEMKLRLDQIIIQTLEGDIPQYANLNVSTTKKLKHLLSIIAKSVPFKPNFSKIAEIIKVSRNSLDDYFFYMEKAGLIIQLRQETKGIRSLGKVSKVYLNNPNLLFNLGAGNTNPGNLRETFFYNQMMVNHQVFSSKEADFIIENKTFKIGGKNKDQKQLPKDSNSYLVKDGIEYGYKNVIPLWAFGLNY